MANELLMGSGLCSCLIGGCVVPLDDRDAAPDTPTSAPSVATDLDRWTFTYEEAQQRVTARRGEVELVYRLREMGAESAGLIAAWPGYDGAE